MPKQLKVAVSGASGFVGASLVKELELRGHSVLRMVRRTGQLKDNELAWVPEQGLVNPEVICELDAVCHLAGRSIAAGRWSAAEKQRIRDSRVLSTQQLVKQLVASPSRPSTFISASAVGIYGDCSDAMVDETHPAGEDFLARVACEWEAAANPLSENEVRVVHPRLGIVLDSRGGALAKMLPIFRLGIAGRLGNGSQYWSWMALSDVVQGLCWALENETVRGAYNFVATQPVTNAEFTSLLAKALHRPAVLPAPAFLLRLATGEMADALLLASCRAIPQRLEHEQFSMRYRTLSHFFEDHFNR
jgi:uncharacterized protein